MKKILTFSFILTLQVLSLNLFAGSLEIGPTLKSMSGKTNYIIYPTPYRSQLDFPLNLQFAGAEAKYSFKKIPLKISFEFALPLKKKISENMIDLDWNNDVLFSDTNSDAEAKKAYFFKLAASYLIRSYNIKKSHKVNFSIKAAERGDGSETIAFII